MPFDAVKNFCKGTLNAGIAQGASTLTLQTGQGAKFPNPSTDGQFNIVVWNYTDYPDPSDDPNVEVKRCTARSGDVLTISGGQEGTSDVAHNTAGKEYRVMLGITAKTIVDLVALINGLIVEANSAEAEAAAYAAGAKMVIRTDLLTAEPGTALATVLSVTSLLNSVTIKTGATVPVSALTMLASVVNPFEIGTTSGASVSVTALGTTLELPSVVVTAVQNVSVSATALAVSATLGNATVPMGAVELYGTSLFNDANLVAYYRMEDLTDSKGSNTLTNIGSTPFSAGKFNNGAVGNGSSRALRISGNNVFGLAANAARTYSMWIKVNTEPTSGQYFNFVSLTKYVTGSTQYYDGFGYYNNSGTKQLYGGIYRGDGVVLTHNVNLGTTNWHHLAVTYSGGANGTQKFYLDGVEVATGTQTTTTPANNSNNGLAILANVTDIQWSNIAVDDFAFFSRALSGTEIANIYNGV